MRISDWSSDVCASDLSLSACGPGRIGADRAMELDDRKSRTGACPMTIQLYTWSTPNGRKISILLEELGVPYEVHTIDITKDEQFSQDFLAINPNNRSEEHTSELQSLMRISYAVFCLKKNKINHPHTQLQNDSRNNTVHRE